MRRSLLLVNPQFPQGDKASGMKRTCWKELWVHDRSQEGCSIIPYMRGVWYLWSMISQSSNRSITHELIGTAIDIKSKNSWMLTWKVKAVILAVCTYIHTGFARPWSRDRFYMRAQPPDWIQICVEPDQQAVLGFGSFGWSHLLVRNRTSPAYCHIILAMTWSKSMYLHRR